MFFRAISVLTASCLALGCSASQKGDVLVAFLDDAPARAGTDWCVGRAVEQEASAITRSYLAQSFVVHRWRGEPSDDAKPIPEAEVFDALALSRLGLTLLVAPPGQGKTRFAQALEARLCGSMPILRLDVSGEFPRYLAAEQDDVVAAQLARQLKLPAGDKQQEFRKLVADARWVLVVDSLHEVPLANRQAVIHALRSLIERNPRHLQVMVLARPDVLLAEPGVLPFDTVLEIPPLDCLRAETAVASLARDHAPQFWRWLAAHGLDRRQQQAGGRCSYQHLTSFRSVRVMVDTAQAMGVNGTPAQFQAGLDAARMPVVRRFAQNLLAHDMLALRVLPDTALDIVATMAATHPSAVLASEVPFTLPACVTAAKGRVADPTETCRRLLDTAMFSRGPGPGQWRLAGAPLDDLVRADVLAARITRDGCDAVTAAAMVVATGDTAGLLVGTPQGGRCLSVVAAAVCGQVGVDAAVQKLGPSLPRGAARGLSLQAAVAAQGCAVQVIEKLKTP